MTTSSSTGQTARAPSSDLPLRILTAVGSRTAYAAAFVVSLSAFGAVVLYRYVDIPAFGPFPAMYDPTWFFEKSLSAAAEAAAAILAGVGFVRAGHAVQPAKLR